MVMGLVDLRRKLGWLLGRYNALIDASDTHMEATRQMELQSILGQEKNVTVN